tara:strand:+ start:363 stop:467 length:105 start_codon:yes stop_codon:yes gene_type:complete
MLAKTPSEKKEYEDFFSRYDSMDCEDTMDEFRDK